MLDADLAATFARIALANVSSEYPYKLDQVLSNSADVRSPRSLHPAFHGSYDWHSCVHMHWTLVRLLRAHPNHAAAVESWQHLDLRLSADNIAGELGTLAQPHRASFERPYGWGWLLKLATELQLLAATRPYAAAWRDALGPLARTFADRFVDFLPRADYPNRSGAHGNSAFALLLALDYCAANEHRVLQRLIVERAHRWFGRDRRYPADYEPNGDDFLSGGLVEAVLMRRVLGGRSFADWWTDFQPSADALAAWLQPVAVRDASDPKIVHLHGLNLSRAWCWRQLLPALDQDLMTAVETAIETHLGASLHAAGDGDYVGTHWLASFALLALTE